MAPLSDRNKGLLFLAGGLLCLLAAFGLVVTFSGKWQSAEPTTEAGSAARWIEPEPDPAPVPPVVEQQITATTPQKDPTWVIYITGEVKTPGVYKVSPGVRIYQIVDRAGGFTADADAVAINMARPLQDGDHVHVPSRNASGTAVTDEMPRSAVKSDGAILSRATSTGTSEKIDLNHCTRDRLECLPGIGPKTAAAIVLFRQEHGLFRSVEDLIQVHGIGPAKMDRIRGLVTARP